MRRIGYDSWGALVVVAAVLVVTLTTDLAPAPPPIGASAEGPGNPSMTWADLERFQTLATGFVVFAGVILTLWYNSRAVRRERRDERHHEREALRLALLEELQINRRSLKENAETLQNDPPKEQGGAYVPTDLMDDAYRSFLPRIGLLSQDEVGKVMGAYLSLRTYNAKLFLLGTPVHTSPRHVEVPATNVKALAQMQEKMVEPIDEAIASLKRARAGAG